MSKKGANFMICWLHTGNFSTDPLAVKVDIVLEAKTIGSILIPLPLYIMHLKWCSWYLWSPHLHGHAFRILHGKGLMTFAVKFPTNWKQQRTTFSICVTEICIEILQKDCRELKDSLKERYDLLMADSRGCWVLYIQPPILFSKTKPTLTVKHIEN
jgi:hypothetical protein